MPEHCSSRLHPITMPSRECVFSILVRKCCLRLGLVSIWRRFGRIASITRSGGCLRMHCPGALTTSQKLQCKNSPSVLPSKITEVAAPLTHLTELIFGSVTFLLHPMLSTLLDHLCLRSLFARIYKLPVLLSLSRICKVSAVRESNESST